MRPLEVLVERSEYGADYTMGKMYVDGMLFGDTIEPHSLHLSNSMPLAEIKSKKVYGKTCIPTGRYKLTWAYSQRLGGRTYAKKYNGKFPLFNNVPGWSGVLIHPFNYGTESQGCVSVGERWNPGKIINATKGYQDFMDFYFVPAMQRGQEVYITIAEK